MSGFVKSLDKTKYVFFMSFKDGGFLQECKIWDKVSNSIKKRLESEPVYNENFL